MTPKRFKAVCTETGRTLQTPGYVQVFDDPQADINRALICTLRNDALTLLREMAQALSEARADYQTALKALALSRQQVYELEEVKKFIAEHQLKFSPEENKRVIDAFVRATNEAAKSMREFGLALKALNDKLRNVYPDKTSQSKQKRKRRAHFKPHLRRRIKEVIR